MARTSRTRRATTAQARLRLRTASAYLDVAVLVLDDTGRVEMPSVAAGLAVLAGIAGSDAICTVRLGEIHRGDDHRAAADLLERATPDGRKLASTFLRVIDIKNEARYGLVAVALPKARKAVQWADLLVSRAREELER